MINQAAPHFFLMATKQTGLQAVCLCGKNMTNLLTEWKKYTGLQVAIVLSLFISTNKALFVFGWFFFSHSHGWSVCVITVAQLADFSVIFVQSKNCTK